MKCRKRKCKNQQKEGDTKKAIHKAKICQGLYAPLDGDMQTVPRAELEAIAQVLENGREPLKIYTDHMNHEKFFRKGAGY